MRERNNICSFTLIAGLSILLWQNGLSQNEKISNYDRLVINSDGTIVYFEPLDSSLINRIEYRNRVRPIMEIFAIRSDGEKKIQMIDYDSDLRPDFIRIEKAAEDRIMETVSFYRGPMHKNHEESHLEHALEHSFVRRDSVMARELREKLEAMRARRIPENELGVFSGYSLFAELKLKVIESAFTASDSLFQAIAQVTTASLSSLRQAPYLSTRYGNEIKMLISINPHTLGVMPENSGAK